jgi:hypothetical protein
LPANSDRPKLRCHQEDGTNVCEGGGAVLLCVVEGAAHLTHDTDRAIIPADPANAKVEGTHLTL